MGNQGSKRLRVGGKMGVWVLMCGVMLLWIAMPLRAQVSLPYMEAFDTYTGAGVGTTSRAEDMASFSTRTKPTGWLFPFSYEGNSPSDANCPYIWLDQATDGSWAGSSSNVCAGSVTHLECRTMGSKGSGYACLPLVSTSVNSLTVSLYYLTESAADYTLYLGIVSQATIDAGTYADYTRLKSFTGTSLSWVKIEESMGSLVAASSYSGSMNAGGYRIVLEFANSNTVLGYRVYVDSVGMSTPCGTAPYSENFDSYTYDDNKISNDDTFDGCMENPVDYPNHTLPDCWVFPQMTTVKNPDMDVDEIYHPQCWLQNCYKHSAPYALVMKAISSVPNCIAALPATTVPASAVTISFWYRFESSWSLSNFHMQVGVITDVSDTSSFVLLYEASQSNSWTQVTVNLADYLAGDYAAGAYRVALRYVNNYGLGYRAIVDDVSLNVPTCCVTTCVATTGTDTKEACGSYTWIDGNTYTSSTTTPTHTLTNSCGADSTVTLNLTIHTPAHAATSTSACETYTWSSGDGQTYTTSGDYRYSHTDANGCTQVDTLHLTINTPTHTPTTIAACESYTWTAGNGSTYTTSGDYRYSHTDANGCTRVDTLHLTINTPVHDHLTVSTCTNYIWATGDGQTYTASGDYRYNHTDANGCTQVDTLHLTISTVAHTAMTAQGCGSYVWTSGNGSTYTASGTYTHTHTDAGGCTQVDTLHLTIGSSTTGDTNAFSTTNFTWYGTTYSASGDYTHTFTAGNAAGCDSVVTLHYLRICTGTLPYVEAFDQYTTGTGTSWTPPSGYPNTAMPDCWRVPYKSTSTGTYPQAFITSFGALAYVGKGFATKTLPSAREGYVVLDIDFGVDPNSLCMSFRPYLAYCEVRVGYMTDPFDTSTFVCFDTIKTGHAMEKVKYIHLGEKANIPHSGPFFFAFHNHSTGSGGYWGYFALDSVQIYPCSCPNSATSATACESYTWTAGNGQTYTSSGTYLYSHIDAGGCSLVDTLYLTIHTPAHTPTTIAACESYTWTAGDGQTYTASGDYRYSHTDANGCTQVDTLHLTILTPSHTALTTSACETYTWDIGDNQVYTASGDYRYSHPDINGCTQVDTLHLTINNPIHDALAATACETYTWTAGDGNAYNASGNYTYSHADANGCTQVDTLHLTINNAVPVGLTVVECERYTWTAGDGQTYTASGDYLYTHADGVGCNQVDTLHLTINNPVYVQLTEAACETYTWAAGDGQTYTTSGDYLYSHLDANGCTQVDTLHLTVNFPSHEAITETVCNSYTWASGDGNAYTTSGDYRYSHADANNCTQVDTLHLTVHYDGRSSVVQTACDSLSLYGGSYNATGIYEVHALTSEGCDSIITLDLTINYSDRGDTIAEVCDRIEWYGLALYESGDYDSHHYTTTKGCDSTLTLHLTIKHSSSSTERRVVCDTLTWHGSLYEETGTVVYIASNANAEGCDSIITLELTVNYHQSVDTFANVCDSIVWYGDTYESDNVIRKVWPDANGCDSMVFLILTVRNSTQSLQIDTVVENAMPQTFLGRKFYSPTTGQRLITINDVGCDSVIEYTLVVMNNVQYEYTSSVCKNHLPVSWNDQMLNGPGDYVAYLHTVHGADSTVRLHLLIDPTYRDTVEEHLCNGASVTYQNQTYDVEGYYDIMYRSQKGCDSLVVLDLRTHTFQAVLNPVPPILRSDKLDYRVYDLSTGSDVVSRRWYIDWKEQRDQTASPYSGTASPLADSVVVTLAVNSDFCYDSSSVVLPIYHTNIYVPNVFTPLEETNNLFQIYLEDIVECELNIYDRAGRLMFHADDLSQAWDGRNSEGNFCPQGSYVWRLDYTTADQPLRRQMQVGQVLLLR
ncbi:MAG: gliding motility-associated C-terminal domain-containing protein [Bacteroidales bacterium]|nr:gliding motility-associated C-terminal domain-containing protein [Bacteroidales bacterium]